MGTSLLTRIAASVYTHWLQCGLRAYLQSYKIYHFHDTSVGSPLRGDADVNDNRMLKTDGANLPAFLYLMQQHPKTMKRIEMTMFGNALFRAFRPAIPAIW